MAMLAALTTNVTHFFRENHHFEHLKSTFLPPLLDAAKREQIKTYLRQHGSQDR